MALYLCGCSTIQQPPVKSETFQLDPLTIVVAPQLDVDVVAQSHGVEDQLRGLTLRQLRLVMVRWSDEVDDHGEPQPDFEALGHEVWHCLKGKFHE